MARRRYVVTGTQGVQDPETLGTVDPGGSITVEADDDWTRGQVASGVLTLETEVDPTAMEMPCPLCTEQGVKKVPAFATPGELEAHYTDRHAGFVVPEWKER